MVLNSDGDWQSSIAEYLEMSRHLPVVPSGLIVSRISAQDYVLG